MVKMTLCYCDKLHSLVFIIIDKRTEDISCLLVTTEKNQRHTIGYREFL